MRTRYSDNEIQKLKAMWPAWPMTDIRKALPHRSDDSLRVKASSLGVKRSKGIRYTSYLRVPLDTNAAPVIRELRAERIRQRLTLVELAKRAGYNKERFCDWETGKAKPRMRTLSDWCDALGLELTVRPKAVALRVAA